MRRKGSSYLGGHTVITQPPSLYIKRLGTEAVETARKARKKQEWYDNKQEQIKSKARSIKQPTQQIKLPKGLTKTVGKTRSWRSLSTDS